MFGSQAMDPDRIRAERELGCSAETYQHILRRLESFPDLARRSGFEPRVVQQGSTARRLLEKPVVIPEITGWPLMHTTWLTEEPRRINLVTHQADLYACADGRFCFAPGSFLSTGCLAQFIARQSHYAGSADLACRAFDLHIRQALLGKPTDLDIPWPVWLTLPDFIRRRG